MCIRKGICLAGRKLKSVGPGRERAGGQFATAEGRRQERGTQTLYTRRYLLRDPLCQALRLAVGPQAQTQRLVTFKTFLKGRGEQIHKRVDKLRQTYSTLSTRFMHHWPWPSPPQRMWVPFLCPSGTFLQNPSNCHLCGCLCQLKWL